MADPPPYPDSGEHTGIPRWVKVLAIVVAIVAVLIAVMLLLGVGGEHGPGRHALSGSDGGQAASSSLVMAAHTPPAGGHG